MAKANRIENRQKAPMKIGFHRKKHVQRWNYVVRDEYTLKAQREWFRARSVYKLLEMQDRFNLIMPEYRVLDVGCFPWSFLQAIQKIVGNNLIVWVDLKECKPFAQKNIKTVVGDIFEYDDVSAKIKELSEWIDTFDIITSDIWPNTTGIQDVDQYNSVMLNIEICKFSDKFLKVWGNMILKVFQGEDFYLIAREVKKRFKKMTTYKPMACRESSHEEYIICQSKLEKPHLSSPAGEE